MKKKNLLILFLTFLKIGAFTFGGGYAMIAILENEFVEKKKWITKEEFLDMVAIAESTPGPIAINSATYIGYRQAGFFGSLFSTLGVVIPSFVIIFLISLFFDEFLQFKYVQYAFNGIQACVVYLILSAGIKMLKGLKKTALNVVIFVGVICAMLSISIFAWNFSSIYLILISGTIGLVVYYVGLIKKKDEVEK